MRVRCVFPAAAALLLVWAVPSCVKPDPLPGIAASAGTSGRAAAAGTLVTAWKAGELKFDNAIDLAFEMVDAAANNRPVRGGGVPTSAAATAFAGSVLDAMAMVESQLPQDAEFEIFWMRVGGLAFAAAEEAHAKGRVPESRTLVLAGPRRWQTEAYWLKHQAHDGLASVILARSGEMPEAVARLRNRGTLDGPAAEVYQMLTGSPN